MISKNTHQRKNTPGESSQERETPPWNSLIQSMLTLPEHQSGSHFFQGAPLPCKPRPVFAEARSLGKGVSLLWLCRRLGSISDQVFQPCLTNTNTKAGGCTVSACTHTQTQTHTHTLIHTYIPFPVHCMRPSRGGSRWAVPAPEDPSSILLGSPSQPAGDLISSSDSAWLQMKPPPSRSSFLWLTLGSFYRRISSSRKRLTQSSLQPFQLLKAATHLLPLPRRLAAPPSPRNSAATATQVQGHLSSRFHICPGIPRRPANPSTSYLLCLDWKDLGSSSLAWEILVPTSSPAPIGCESVSLARLLEWGGPSVASSGLYPPGEIDLEVTAHFPIPPPKIYSSSESLIDEEKLG